MIRIAVCCHDAPGRVLLRDAVERYAAERGICNVEVSQFASAKVLERAVGRMREGFFGLCVFRICGDSQAPAEIEDIRALHAESPGIHLVLTSDNKEHAIFAYELDAGFVLSSDSYDEFARAMAGPFDGIVQADGAVAAVRTRNGVENVVLADILFVESSKRGSIIHFPAGKTVAARSTLQSLFESLAGMELPEAGEGPGEGAGCEAVGEGAGGDAGGAVGEGEGVGEGAAGAAGGEGAAGEGAAGEGAGAAAAAGASAAVGAAERDKRFVKAGSSFIVNLDNVRSAGEGSLIFADGQTIIVPIRKRKAVLDALHSYQRRS